MTTTRHSPLPFGGPLTSAAMNSPLSQLDSAIGAEEAARAAETARATAIENVMIAGAAGGWATVPTEVVVARGGYATLGEKMRGSVFDVRDYWAVGDGTTDDTAAINAAIVALNAAGNGVLYFPAGIYKVTAALTAIHVMGPTTGGVQVRGDGHSYADVNGGGGSQINCTSPTANLFTVEGVSVQFRDLGLRNTYAGTPTAGAAIVASGDLWRYDNLAVSGFYVDIDHANGATWRMTGCWLCSPVHLAMRIRNGYQADAGDWAISDSWFVSDIYDTASAIRIESAGGGKITNVKVVGFLHGDKMFSRCIDVAPASGVATSILLISNCSFEGYTEDAIHVDTNGNTYDMISVIGCEFGTMQSTGYAVWIDGVNGVIIDNYLLVSNPVSPVAFHLANGSYGKVGTGVNRGYVKLLETSAFGNLLDETIPPLVGMPIWIARLPYVDVAKKMPDLLGYWRFGEASGTSAADASGKGHTGTYVNSPTLGVTGLLTGDADTAVTTLNPNVYISVPDHADFDCFEGRNPWTFAVWIDNHTPNADYQNIFRKGAATGSAKVAIISHSTSFILVRSDASSSMDAYAPTLTAGRHLVGASYDGAYLRLYVDGAMAGPAIPTTLTLPALAGAITFGTDGYWDCFSGTYDEGKIWGRALSDTEWAMLWALGTGA